MTRNQMPLPDDKVMFIDEAGLVHSPVGNWLEVDGRYYLEQVVCSAVGCSIAIGLWSLVL